VFRAKDREKCQRLFEKEYRGRKFFDGLYREQIARHLRPGQRLLDAGCGRYMKYCKDLSSVARVFGVDCDQILETDSRRGPFGIRGDIHHLPFPANSFDIVLSRSVVEHLENPAQAFQEWARVLRPGGKVIILTPNKYDYVSVIAAITPYWLHRALVSRIFQVSDDDVFPTRYRANTRSALRKALQAAGMCEVDLQMLNHYPAYLMFSPVLFRIGVVYERLTRLRMFQGLSGAILCVFQKRLPSSHAGRAGVSLSKGTI